MTAVLAVRRAKSFRLLRELDRRLQHRSLLRPGEALSSQQQFAGQRGLRLWRVDAGVHELADEPVALGEPRHAVEEEVVPVLPG